MHFDGTGLKAAHVTLTFAPIADGDRALLGGDLGAALTAVRIRGADAWHVTDARLKSGMLVTSARATRARWMVLPLALALSLGLQSSAGAETREHLAMPFRCEVTGGQLRMQPAPDTGYTLYGPRSEQSFTLCQDQDTRRCRTLMLQRFDFDCGGTRVSWMAAVAAAAPHLARRLTLESGRIVLQGIRPQPLAPEDCPNGRPGRFGDNARRFNRNGTLRGCGPRPRPAAVERVALPPGYAPLPIVRARLLGTDAAAVDVYRQGNIGSSEPLVSSAPRAGTTAPQPEQSSGSPAPPGSTMVRSPLRLPTLTAGANPSAPTDDANGSSATSPEPVTVTAPSEPPRTPPRPFLEAASLEQSPPLIAREKLSANPAPSLDRVGGWLTSTQAEALGAANSARETATRKWPGLTTGSGIAGTALLLGLTLLIVGRRRRRARIANDSANLIEPSLEFAEPVAARHFAEPVSVSRPVPVMLPPAPDEAKPAVLAAVTDMSHTTKQGNDPSLAAAVDPNAANDLGDLNDTDDAAKAEIAEAAQVRAANEELRANAQKLSDLVHCIVEDLVPDGPLRELLRGELQGTDRRLASLELAIAMAGRSVTVARPVLEQIIGDLQRIQALARIEHERISDVPLVVAASPSIAQDIDESHVPATRDEAIAFLGLHGEANQRVVKKLIDALRQAWHPDLALNERDRQLRETRMKQINGAWDLLRSGPSLAERIQS